MSGTRGEATGAATDLSVLFHRLNNQLGVALANAELLEARSGDEISRSRAEQVVSGVLGAMSTAKALRLLLEARPTRLA